MCTICGSPHTPNEVRQTIHKRFSGEGPSAETNSGSIAFRLENAVCTPPILLNRKIIIRHTPAIITMPCTKSISTEPRYPPRNTAISVKTAMAIIQTSTGSPNVDSNR